MRLAFATAGLIAVCAVLFFAVLHIATFQGVTR